MTTGASRRTLLALGTAGAVAAVTGCTVYGRDADSQASDDGPASDNGQTSDQETAGPDDAPAEGGDVLVATGEVEVGGGVILDGVVVTQPSSGEFKGFSSTCTHQGCAVTSVSDGTINCPCHGSRFSIEDGSVVQPAAGLSADSQNPLPEVPITVDGDSVRLG